MAARTASSRATRPPETRGPVQTHSSKQRHQASRISLSDHRHIRLFRRGQRDDGTGSARMRVTRREFVRNGVSAAVAGVALPRFVSDLVRAQGAFNRNLVVLNLNGGNDGLSMLVPYSDPFYASRRPTLAIPAGTLLQVGSDSSGKPLGLHPRLTGLLDIFG